MPHDTLDRLLADAVRARPDAPAILTPDRDPLTYGALAGVVDRTAATLRAAGIRRADRVALVTANGPEAATAFLGIAAAAAAVPLNPVYRRDEVAFELTDLGARAVIVQAGLDTPAAEVARELGIRVLVMTTHVGAPAGAFELEPLPPDAGAVDADGTASPAADPAPSDPADIALVLHTSGTTARPKIVPLTQHDLLAPRRGTSARRSRSPRPTCCLNVMPLFHIHGLSRRCSPRSPPAASVVCDRRASAPPTFFDWLDASRAHLVHGRADDAPGRPRACRAPAASIARARRCASCARRRPRCRCRVLDALEAAFGAPVIEAYGMTEAAHQMASNPLPPLGAQAGLGGSGDGPRDRDPRRSTARPARRARSARSRSAAPPCSTATRPTPRPTRAPSSTAGSGPATRGMLDDDGYLFLTAG